MNAKDRLAIAGPLVGYFVTLVALLILFLA